jgi:hypothetical protein
MTLRFAQSNFMPATTHSDFYRPRKLRSSMRLLQDMKNVHAAKKAMEGVVGAQVPV